ncbi:hypothetical protein D3C76_629440 [compost metagenome]
MIFAFSVKSLAFFNNNKITTSSLSDMLRTFCLMNQRKESPPPPKKWYEDSYRFTLWQEIMLRNYKVVCSGNVRRYLE